MRNLASGRGGKRALGGGGLAVLVALAGCGPGGIEPVPVEGVVTLDGSPLADAHVLFRPTEGRPSAGKTDAQGRYRLRYTAERDGALPGTHAVSITMLADDAGDDDGGSQPRRESIPARYNSQSELSAEVGRSRTTLDFDLESKRP